jgi:hypothetical protein
MVSMIFLAFGVPTPSVEYMLSTIQWMRFYLRTGFRDSEDYAGGDQAETAEPIRTQGMCQGNGASPAAWLVTSIPMIQAHRKKGHGTQFLAPISGRTCHLIGGLFVDNTDLFYLNMQWIETAVEAHARLQDSVLNWGRLLLATGWALKPAKCLFYLLSFQWKADGSWVYDLNDLNPDFTLGVPMADGNLEEIKHLSCSTALKTLGSMTCPTGSSTAALDRMQSQGQEWVDKVLTSSLSCQNMWFMVDCQFWPRLGYGICNNSASWKDLESCLQQVYWQLVGRGGV